jgi:hypothetical protein
LIKEKKNNFLKSNFNSCIKLSRKIHQLDDIVDDEDDNNNYNKDLLHNQLWRKIYLLEANRPELLSSTFLEILKKFEDDS